MTEYIKNQPTKEDAPTVFVFSLDRDYHACAVIRIIAPLQASGWHVVWVGKQHASGFSFDMDGLENADLIIIQRHFPSAFTRHLLQKIICQEAPVVYDLDDMFLDMPRFHPSYKLLNERAPYIKWILKEADLVTVSTPQLQKSLAKYTSRPIHVNPNLIDWELFNAKPRPRTTQFNLFISGTPTHQKDWQIIEAPLTEFLNTYKNDVKAIFFGEIPKNLANHPSIQLIEFQENYYKYAECLKNLDIHAALVPLQDIQFNQCKSNIKWLEYSAAGIPGAYSDVTPYRSSIMHGKTGLLVTNTADAWFQAMKQLLEEPEASHAMLANAQQEIYKKFANPNLSDDYLAFYKQLQGKKHKSGVFTQAVILPDRIKRFLLSLNKYF